MKKILAIDMDETIVETFRYALAQFKLTRPHITIDYDDVTNHEWYKIPDAGVTYEESVTHWKEFFADVEFQLSLPPIEYASETIRSLTVLGWETHIVTARRKDEAYDLTHAWVSRHFPDIENRIIFCDNHSALARPKWQVCQEIGAHVFIDDNIDYALPVAEAGIPTFLINRPWNRSRPETCPGMTRVDGWRDIGALLKNGQYGVHI